MHINSGSTFYLPDITLNDFILLNIMVHKSEFTVILHTIKQIEVNLSDSKHKESEPTFIVHSIKQIEVNSFDIKHN